MSRRTDVLAAGVDASAKDDASALAETFAPSSTNTARRRWGGSTASTRDRYRVAFELASGGMASVYIARRDAPGGFAKMVALKRVHQHMARDRDSMRMFLDEARLASRINHPNVCQVFDFGSGRDGLYIAMELLEGEVLSNVIKAAIRAEKAGRAMFDTPAWRRVAVRLLVDAAEGLHAVHEATGIDGMPLNVVHRDVAPQNLFVTFDGTTKLLDLGIAHAEHRLTRTSTGVIKGHLAYVAPEQIRGQSLDRRADVWSLGVVAWEAFAGRRLFHRANTAETLFAVINDSIPPLEALRPDVPKSVSDVLSHALSRPPGDRHSSTLAFSVALADAATEGIATRPEVSAFMDALFPDGRAKMRALVQKASRIADDLAQREQGRRRAMTALAVGAGIAALSSAFGVGLLVADGPLPAGDEEDDAPEPEPAAGGPGRTAEAASEPAPTAEPELAVEPEPTAPTEAAIAPTAPEEPSTPDEARRTQTGPGQGELRVAVEGMRGWARVALGRRDLGRTPFARRVPAGHHMLRVTFDDGSTRRVPVRVHRGQTTAISLRHP